MSTSQESQKDMKKYVITYSCIVLIAALQFIATYHDAGSPQLWSHLLFLAIVEAVLAVLFFMTYGWKIAGCCGPSWWSRCLY
jgi:cytochrome c oxidase subunit IV